MALDLLPQIRGLVSPGAGRDEALGEARLPRHGPTKPDPEPVADLDGLEGFAPLATVPMDRVVARLAPIVHQVENVARRDPLRLRASKHV